MLALGRTRVSRRTLRPCAASLALCLVAGISAAETPDSAAERRIVEASKLMLHAEKMGGTKDAHRKHIVEFVAGNVMFVLTHELGHAVVSEMGIPVLGRLEDAADSFAITAMLEMGTDMSVRTLIEATRGWFLSSRREAAEGVTMRFFDAHALSSQRAYQIICLMVGSDPMRFDALAAESNMPLSRRQSCAADFSNASWSWEKVLRPHLRDEATKPVAIAVQYEPGRGDLAVYERALRATQMLERMAYKASHKLNWRAPFRIEARNCGMPNAYWSLPSRTLVVCYELAADFAQLFRQYGLMVEAAK